MRLAEDGVSLFRGHSGSVLGEGSDSEEVFPASSSSRKKEYAKYACEILDGRVGTTWKLCGWKEKSFQG